MLLLDSQRRTLVTFAGVIPGEEDSLLVKLFFLVATIIHIMLNVEPTLAATNQLTACLQEIWQRLHYFELMFSGFCFVLFFVEILILGDTYFCLH